MHLYWPYPVRSGKKGSQLTFIWSDLLGHRVGWRKMENKFGDANERCSLYHFERLFSKQ